MPTSTPAVFPAWSAYGRAWPARSFISPPTGAWNRGSPNGWRRSAPPRRTSIIRMSLLPSRHSDFDACLADQLHDADGGTRRPRFGDNARVYSVHLLEVVHIGEVDLNGHQVLHS